MSNIQTGAERMPHDLSHLGFLAGQIGRLITISTTPVRSEERFSRNAETDLVCRLLLEKKNVRPQSGWTGRRLVPVVVILLAAKEVQECAVHWARLFDDIT